MVDLTTKIGNVVLKNPVMPASGTFSEELSAVFDIGVLGAHVAKTITAEIRSGNPTPRVSEVGYSMLNSIGIPSKGIQHFKDEILPLYQKYETPFVASISAPTVDEFAFICEEISIPGVDVIEVPSKVIYPEENTSNFDVLKDNILITQMHTRLVFGMLRRVVTFQLRWKS